MKNTEYFGAYTIHAHSSSLSGQGLIYVSQEYVGIMKCFCSCKIIETESDLSVCMGA